VLLFRPGTVPPIRAPTASLTRLLQTIGPPITMTGYRTSVADIGEDKPLLRVAHILAKVDEGERSTGAQEQESENRAHLVEAEHGSRQQVAIMHGLGRPGPWTHHHGM
jgi:hypothetical protein